MQSDHNRITDVGWVYRTNERGWTIYRDPKTGRWHTRDDAVALVEHDMIAGVRAAVGVTATGDASA